MIAVTPIPETSPIINRSSAVSAMCQQLSQGLSLLSSADDPFLSENQVISAPLRLKDREHCVPVSLFHVCRTIDEGVFAILGTM